MTPVIEPKILRDAAVRYLASTGWNAPEIASLNLSDFNFVVWDTTLTAWLSARRALNPPTPALFVSLHWGHGAGPNLRRLSARSVRRIISV